MNVQKHLMAVYQVEHGGSMVPGDIKFTLQRSSILRKKESRVNTKTEIYDRRRHPKKFLRIICRHPLMRGCTKNRNLCLIACSEIRAVILLNVSEILRLQEIVGLHNKGYGCTP